MNTQTLTTLAEGANGYASRLELLAKVAETDRYTSKARLLRVAAQDAEREAQAANGYGSEAAYMWAVCVENDQALDKAVRAMVAEHVGRETARADLADALKDWTEDAAGMEGANYQEGEIVGMRGEGYPLSNLMQAMVRVAIVAVDWHCLAVVLLDAHAEREG